MLNKENWVDIITIIFASSSTICAIIFSYKYEKIQILLLTILTILLPIIYQIGNIISKECVREQTSEDLNILETAIDDLEKENMRLKLSKR